MLLEVKQLGIAYGRRPPVVRDVSFTLDAGEVLAIVGESGSGKTTVIRSIMHILPGGGHIAEGTVLFQGEDTRAQPPARRRKLCGPDMSMIFQDCGAMMNPIRSIGRQFRDYLSIHGVKNPAEAHALMTSMLAMVRLPDPERILKSYPFELSGGQMQRLMIARIFLLKPKILLADEPTSMVDACSRATILDMLLQLRDEIGMTVIFITHDIGLAYYISDTVYIMEHGRFVEFGKADEVILNPKAAYTKRLISDVPKIHEEWDLSTVELK